MFDYSMDTRWKTRNNNKMLEARFEFDTFEQTRDFLDEVAGFAESLEHHPNISFGKNYASIAIYAKDGELQEIDRTLAEEIDGGFTKITKN